MNKSLVFNIETQTEDSEVISLCFVNENTIALETSQIARTLFKRNRPLFDRINSSTKMLGGTLYRQEIMKSKANNTRLYTHLDNKFESNEVEISQLFFEDNILKRQVRAITVQGRKVDYDPTKLKDGTTSGFLDFDNLTVDDVDSMTKVCEVEEISLFENIGVKTIMVTDNLKEKRSLLKVGYRIEFNVDTDFKEYIDLVMSRLDKSITFMTSYLNQVQTTSFYDSETLTFKKTFADSIMNGLGIAPSLVSSDLGRSQVKSSEFGQAALNYYNGLLLLSANVDREVYGTFLKSVLPTSRTSPSTISETLNSISLVYSRVKKAYFYGNSSSNRDRKFSKVGSVKGIENKLEAFSTESLIIDKEILGYSIFSSTQKGLNKLSTADYKTRFALEQAKYYPSITPDDATGFMTPSERSQFSRIDNAPAFITPIAMMLGDKKVSTNRGMRNMDVDFVRQFRLAKSSRAQRAGSESYPTGVSRGRLSNDIMSEFNIQIGRPQKTLLGRSTEQEIDPLIEVEKYIGDSSTFSTNNPTALLKSFRRILSREDRRVLSIVSDIVPRRFLRQNDAIRSIKQLSMSNPNSLIRRTVTAQAIDLASIPPQVKYMCTQAFAPNPESDPIQNSESSQIIEETQKNLFLVKSLTGFGRDAEGFIDVRQPVYAEMNLDLLSTNGPILAKAFDYEVPELGIVKDNFMATIYSNLIYIRG
jgi:hypothetical protein